MTGQLCHITLGRQGTEDVQFIGVKEIAKDDTISNDRGVVRTTGGGLHRRVDLLPGVFTRILIQTGRVLCYPEKGTLTLGDHTVFLSQPTHHHRSDGTLSQTNPTSPHLRPPQYLSKPQIHVNTVTILHHSVSPPVTVLVIRCVTFSSPFRHSLLRDVPMIVK